MNLRAQEKKGMGRREFMLGASAALAALAAGVKPQTTEAAGNKPPCSTDVTGDGVVNGRDVEVVRDAIDCPGRGRDACGVDWRVKDVNFDEQVTAADLSIVRKNTGRRRDCGVLMDFCVEDQRVNFPKRTICQGDVDAIEAMRLGPTDFGDLSTARNRFKVVFIPVRNRELRDPALRVGQLERLKRLSQQTEVVFQEKHKLPIDCSYLKIPLPVTMAHQQRCLYPARWDEVEAVKEKTKEAAFGNSDSFDAQVFVLNSDEYMGCGGGGTANTTDANRKSLYISAHEVLHNWLDDGYGGGRNSTPTTEIIPAENENIGWEEGVTQEGGLRELTFFHEAADRLGLTRERVGRCGGENIFSYEGQRDNIMGEWPPWTTRAVLEAKAVLNPVQEEFIRNNIRAYLQEKYGETRR